MTDCLAGPHLSLREAGRDTGGHPRWVVDPLAEHPGIGTIDEVAALVSTDKLAQVASSRGCVDTHGDGLEGVYRGDQLAPGVDRVAADHRGAGPGRERVGRSPGHPLSIELASVA